jgi:biotin carboxyl carrier protein
VILQISSKDRKMAVEVKGAGNGSRATVDGREFPLDWIRLPDGSFSLILDGRVYDFIVELSEDACAVIGRAGTQTVHIADARRLPARREPDAGPAGLRRLKADMPGKVVRVLVKEGDTVTIDQGLLVLEAMKMQNEIRAPKSGVIREVRVAPGMAVGTNEFLLSLE